MRVLFRSPVAEDVPPTDADEQPFEPPYRLDVTDKVGAILAEFDHLADGEETDRTATVAGRVMLLRDQGRLAFATLREGSTGDEIQLFALSKVLDGFDRFVKLNLGDWIGATGEVVRTQRGELSIHVSSFAPRARARRGLGAQFHSITAHYRH